MSFLLRYIKKYPFTIIALVLGAKYSFLWSLKQNRNFKEDSPFTRIRFGLELPYLSFPTRMVEEENKKRND